MSTPFEMRMDAAVCLKAWGLMWGTQVNLPFKLKSYLLDFLLHLPGSHGPVWLPGLEMPDLLAGAVGAPGDGDLVAGPGLALYLLDACHIWPPFRGSPVLFASPPLSLLYIKILSNAIYIIHNIAFDILLILCIAFDRQAGYNRLYWENRLYPPPVPRIHDNLPGPSAAALPAAGQHSPADGTGPEWVQLLPAARAAVPPPPANFFDHSYLRFLVHVWCTTHEKYKVLNTNMENRRNT